MLRQFDPLPYRDLGRQMTGQTRRGGGNSAKTLQSHVFAQYNQAVVHQQRTLMKKIGLTCLAFSLVVIIGIGFEVVLRSRFDTVYTPLVAIVAFAGLIAGLCYVTRWIRELRESRHKP